MVCPYYYDAWKAMWTLRYLHNDSSSSLLSLWVKCLFYIEKYLLKEIVYSNFTWSTTPRSLAVNCWHQGDVYCIEVRPLMNWFIANINRCSQISSRILRCFHISSIMLSATQIKTIPPIDSLQFQVQTFSGKVGNFQRENSLKLSSLHWLDSCLLFAEVAADLERNWKLYFAFSGPDGTVCVLCSQN